MNKKLYSKCLEFATKAHEGQFRWDGVTPYINHPIAVAKSCRTPRQKYIALLHDVLEDTDTTSRAIIKAGFKEIIPELYLLTKNPTDTYSSYIKRIGESCNEDAIIVKINDITHNMSNLDKTKDKQRIEKYELALLYLEAIYDSLKKEDVYGLY